MTGALWYACFVCLEVCLFPPSARFCHSLNHLPIFLHSNLFLSFCDGIFGVSFRVLLNSIIQYLRFCKPHGSWLWNSLLYALLKRWLKHPLRFSRLSIPESGPIQSAFFLRFSNLRLRCFGCGLKVPTSDQGTIVCTASVRRPLIFSLLIDLKWNGPLSVS